MGLNAGGMGGGRIEQACAGPVKEVKAQTTATLSSDRRTPAIVELCEYIHRSFASQELVWDKFRTPRRS
jgi:hypothetical protein